MWDNIVIRGIEEAQNESWEDTEKKVVQFMKDQLKIDDANEAMLDRAHRIGKKIPEKHRNIVVKFASSHDKSQIFKNIKNLAEKKQYSIQEQYPQEVQERRKRLWPLFKEAKERAKHDRTHKVSWSVDKLNINGRMYTAKDDIQCISPSEQCEQNVHIEHSKKQSEEGSVFQGHAASLSQDIPVAAVLAELYADSSIAKAQHNMYAYRNKIGNEIKEACSDDGEHGAGNRLLQLLREAHLTDVVVICTRWFGGVHIGPQRFQYITDCAKEALLKIPAKNRDEN